MAGYAGSADRPWYVGATYSDQTFQGALDDFRLYDRALSPQEIVQLFYENGFSR
jgi:hypothetical protein